MCMAFILDCRYDNSIIKPIGRVFCANTVCSDILCLHKRTLRSLKNSEYHCPQCSFLSHVRNFPFKEQTMSFFLKFGPRICIFKRRGNQLKMVLEMCFVRNAGTKNVFNFQPVKTLVPTSVESAKPTLTYRIFPLRTNNWQ